MVRLDAEEDLLGLRVLLPQVMRVVRAHERDTGLAGQADELGADLRLLGQAVVLDLQEEVPLAEDVAVFEGAGLRLFIVAVHERGRDVTGETAGQSDEPARVFPEDLPVHARFAVKAFRERKRHEFHEVRVALVVLAEEDQVVPFVGERPRLVVPTPRGDVRLHPEDGFDAGLLTGFIKGNGAIHDAVIGKCQTVLAQLFGPGHQFRYAAGAVEKTVFSVKMKMSEGHGGPPCCRKSWVSSIVVSFGERGASGGLGSLIERLHIGAESMPVLDILFPC